MTAWLRLIAACLALSSVSNAADSEPRIEARAGKPVLVLPAAMQDAVRRFDPAFRLRRMVDYPPMFWRRGCDWSKDCTRLLYKLNPREAPFAVIGDFNGDGTLDVVMDGDTPTEGRRIAVLSRGPAFVASEVHWIQRVPEVVVRSRSDESVRHWEVGVEGSLSLAKPGPRRSPHEPKPLVLKTDGFVHGSEKGASLYYLRNGAWRQYIVAD